MDAFSRIGYLALFQALYVFIKSTQSGLDDEFDLEHFHVKK